MINRNEVKIMLNYELKKGLFCIMFMAGVMAEATHAQVGMNMDIMSRYVWRGADFGNSPSIQPEITYGYGGLEIGSWAAVATTGNPDGYEVDWFANYTFETGSGDFSLYLIDYTFPVPGTGDYFSSEAHFLEAGAGVSELADTPLSFFGGMFLTNDEDHSIYLELAYDLKAVGFVLGMTPSESAMYGTSGPAIIHTGITAGKALHFSESLEIGLSTSIILNPHSEDLFFLVGLGL